MYIYIYIFVAGAKGEPQDIWKELKKKGGKFPSLVKWEISTT